MRFDESRAEQFWLKEQHTMPCLLVHSQHVGQLFDYQIPLPILFSSFDSRDRPVSIVTSSAGMPVCVTCVKIKTEQLEKKAIHSYLLR